MADNKVQLYTRYPLSSLLIYNGATVAHYFLGAVGIALGYGSVAGYWGGLVYLVLALSEMYLHMPLKVCPNCVYRNPEPLATAGWLVISGRLYT